MEQLSCLWNLEVHHNSLRTYKKEFDSLEDESMIKNTETKLLEMEDKLTKLKSNQVSIKKKLGDAERKLKEYNFNIEEVEKALYNGQTKDIRQLEYLVHEKEKLKKIINDKELEILEFMEEIEDADIELSKIERSVKEIREKNIEIKKHYQNIKEGLIKKIQFEKDKIKKLEEEIDKVTLDKYAKIRRARGTGIVVVNNGTCSGCNMFIPTILIDRLNNSSEIIYCESCGRILCKL